MLRLLGIPRVELAEQSSVELPVRVATLVALVEMAPGKRLARSRAAELIWSESERPAASANLRQILLRLRTIESAVGLSILHSSGTVLERGSGTVDSDVAFLREFSAEEPRQGAERLIELAGAPLLEPIVLAATAAELEIVRWRDELHEELVDKVLGVCASLAPKEAMRLAKHILEVAPFEDRICRVLVRATNEARGSKAASEVFLQYSARLRKQLDAKPEQETLELARSLLNNGKQAEAPESESAMQQKPRLAILPSRVIAYRTDASAISAGRALLEDVTFHLSRARSVAVMAPHSAARLSGQHVSDIAQIYGLEFLVTSALKPLSESGGVSLELMATDAQTDNVIWADRFELDLAAVASQQAIAEEIAASITGAIDSALLARTQIPGDMTAYMRCVVARNLLQSLDLPRVRRARHELRSALAENPHYAQARAWLARSFMMEWVLRSGPDTELLQLARNHAEAAMSIDPFDPLGYREKGRVQLFLGDIEGSTYWHEEAVALARSHADILADSADANVHAGNLRAAAEEITLAIERNPVVPDHYLWTRAGTNFFSGDYAAAISDINAMSYPDPAARLLAASAALAGRGDLARKARGMVLRDVPDFTVEGWLAKLPQKDKVFRDRYEEGLRVAGFK